MASGFLFFENILRGNCSNCGSRPPHLFECRVGPSSSTYVIDSIGFIPLTCLGFTPAGNRRKPGFSGLKSGCDFFQIKSISEFHSLRKEQRNYVSPYSRRRTADWFLAFPAAKMAVFLKDREHFSFHKF